MQSTSIPEWLPERDRTYLIFGFTGQGQQRPDMLMPWYGYSISTDELLKYFHEVTHTKYGVELDEQQLAKGPLMQPANVALQVVINETLSSQDIRPNEAFGHSLGELAATQSAGFIDADEAIWLARKRGEATHMNISELLANEVETGMLAFTKKSGNVEPDVAEALTSLQLTEDQAFISNKNKPGQVVVSGLKRYFEDLKAILKKQKIFGTVLSVDGPYHSLHMKLAQREFRKSVDRVGIRQPKEIALYSPTTLSRLRTRQHVGSMIVKQLVHPVQYSDLIDIRLKYLNSKRISEKFASEGATEVTFVEIGCYDADRPSSQGVLLNITRDNAETFHSGKTPIRYHRITSPRDILASHD